MEAVVKDAEEVVERAVAKEGNSARVSVPPAWQGRRVKVILLEAKP